MSINHFYMPYTRRELKDHLQFLGDSVVMTTYTGETIVTTLNDTARVALATTGLLHYNFTNALKLAEELGLTHRLKKMTRDGDDEEIHLALEKRFDKLFDKALEWEEIVDVTHRSGDSFDIWYYQHIGFFEHFLEKIEQKLVNLGFGEEDGLVNAWKLKKTR